jgi:hypothetical protein
LQEKELNVAQVLHEDEWIRKLAIDATTSIEHLTQFEQLWANIQMVHLQEDVEDDITWELTGNGQYSVASAYNLQKKLDLWTLASTKSYGRLGQRQSPSITLGWLCNIDFGWPID